MSKTPHVVDGEASESDSEIEIARSPDLETTINSESCVIAGEAPESDDETKLTLPPTLIEADMPLNSVLRPPSTPAYANIYNSLLHQKLWECNVSLRATLEGLIKHTTEISVEKLTRADKTLLNVQVTSENHVCQACWNLAQDVVLGRSPIEAPQVGHSSVCVRCGRSLSAQRHTHLLHNDSPRESAIYNVIREWILPQTVGEADRICHSCWILADRAAVRMRAGHSTSSQSIPPPAQSSVSVSNGYLPTNVSIQPDQNQHSLNAPIMKPGRQKPEQTIVLPDYKRAVETEQRCFIAGCQRTERNRVPLATRKMLLGTHKYYVPLNNRLCDEHLNVESWDFLISSGSNYLKTFTAKHIQDMLFMSGVT